MKLGDLQPDRIQTHFISTVEGKDSTRVMGCFLYHLSLNQVQRRQEVTEVKFTRKSVPTTVLSIQAVIGSAVSSEEQASLVKSALIAAVGQDTGAIVDVWRCTTQFGETAALVRVREDAVDDVLKISGKRDLWVNSPPDKQFRVIWLKGGEDQKTVSLEDARSQLESTAGQHFGLIRKWHDYQRCYHYAVRVLEQHVGSARAALSIAQPDAWILRGVPTDLDESEVAEILALPQIAWSITGKPTGRKFYKGSVQWTIHAEKPPPFDSFGVTVGYHRFMLH
eukprot:6371729-Amphidinium_carterae.1